MRHVVTLALPSGWLGNNVRVRSAVHDIGNRITEATPDLLSGGRPALVFDSVVQEGGDHFVLRTTVLPYDGGDGQQVRHVRNVRALTHLGPVQARSVRQRLLELLAVGQ